MIDPPVTVEGGPGFDPARVGGEGTPLCSIVIPTFNGRELLETCLASIHRHLPPDRARDVEVIVSDDASTDGTAEWLAAAFPSVRVLRRETNGGFCAAANAGIEVARGHFIQLLNNDTEVTAGWIESGLAPFADPTVGSVAPLVLVRSEPWRVDSAGDTYTLSGWPAKRGHGQPAERWAARPADEVFAASGSSAFYRAEALRRVGGFDPLLGSYYEDVDLGFRLRWAGYRCLYSPRCRILHEISATYDHGRPSLQRRMARNAELVFWSNMPAGRLGPAIVLHAFLLATQGCWRLARLRFLPFFLGKLDAARDLKSIRDRRRLRADLARGSSNPAHFPLGVGSFGAVLGHLHRPQEHSARTPRLDRDRSRDGLSRGSR
ncbi:N-acetylglucosaminyl-diphospho-decaprenol L-rhamnosyltransferase [Aquisphaera giovannonii]|uniref:N-acetylglucosaminyl-diphospho-decaprenol L-rhamnosyltransferase n=1 Tax=Aquisphaera giovannonii TaxID=406548 RepID=A0A5B9WBL2_9BACT|nr:glycosyltransferase family 2 protein [Aquisphaera giovannonii]QEH37863.1 N-acetylglucosaminyl-diphospho-decaprenol L-rhamnosyltransferase [Aquisphaera giovannonii]